MKRMLLPLLLTAAVLGAGCATCRPDGCNGCNEYNREADTRAVYDVSWDNTCADYPVTYRSDLSAVRTVSPVPAVTDPATVGGEP